jgi:hypothetical protein
MTTTDKNYILSQMGNLINADANGAITSMNTSSYTSNLGPVGNVTITGGSNGQVLTTNGSGVLDWSTVNTNNVANANYAAYSGIVTGSSQSNITNVGTLTGLTSNGTINFTGASNVSLGAVGNVTITGGSNGQTLTTNGSGTLSWTSPSGGSGLSGPAFFAIVSNGTINVTSTPTNIPANTAALNVGGCYNTTTYRFTPTTAGYYQIGASMKNSTNQTFSNFFCMIYKNGTIYKFLEARSVSSSAMGEVGFATQSMVPMNGTTDYLEIRVSGSPANGSGVMSTIFVEGTYLRGLT